MSKRCIGCGSVLQSVFKNKDGYVNEKIIKTSKYCERCFKIKNYGECSVIEYDKDFNQIINDINKSNASVVYLVDILNVTKETVEFLKYFKNNIFVLLTKRDILPKSVNDKKTIKYFKDNFNVNAEVMCISSYKKINIDKFLKRVRELNIKELYVVGLTNSGKSTFINALMESVGNKATITASLIPNTTIDYIKMKIDENLTIIDTPGFVFKDSIYNYLSYKDVVKVTPKKEIKVKTFQIKEGYSIIIENILRIDYLKGKNNSFSFYMNNNLNYKKIKISNSDILKVLPKKNIHINNKEDLVINGLGFVKIVNSCDIVVYTLDESLINIRKSMI